MRTTIALALALSFGCGVESAPTGHLESEAARSAPLFDNCTFGVNTACDLGFHADSACVEARLGGGYYVETMNRLHCSPSAACGGGAADLRLVRLCNTAGIGGGFVTPCGPTGPFGCAVCWSEPTCEN
jgi:hypothetical protein